MARPNYSEIEDALSRLLDNAYRNAESQRKRSRVSKDEAILRKALFGYPDRSAPRGDYKLSFYCDYDGNRMWVSLFDNKVCFGINDPDNNRHKQVRLDEEDQQRLSVALVDQVFRNSSSRRR